MAARKRSRPATKTSIWVRLGLFLLVAGPVVIAVLLYQADDFDPIAGPDDDFWINFDVPAHNHHVLRVAERVGDGLFSGPEDLVYDPEEGLIYTGCDDGWIKRIPITGAVESDSVENWVKIDGGRPLGLAFGPDKQLVVADANKGLLRVTREGTVTVLANEAEGIKFVLTDGVDVAGDGMIYFTDASYKYKIGEHLLDILEGRPYGRLLSFDPAKNETRVLVRDLYFANGVALSPQHDFLVFCESPRRSCRRYHIHGENKGLVDSFVDNLPGFPDNIHYDGEGRFWIALASGNSYSMHLLMRYRFLRKVAAGLERYFWLPPLQRDGGVLSVSLQGEPLELYTDPALSFTSSGLKIGGHLYYGSIRNPYIIRLDLTKHVAQIKDPGRWICRVIVDPAQRCVTQLRGARLMEIKRWLLKELLATSEHERV